jgi:hypothetical protein
LNDALPAGRVAYQTTMRRIKECAAPDALSNRGYSVFVFGRCTEGRTSRKLALAGRVCSPSKG